MGKRRKPTTAKVVADQTRRIANNMVDTIRLMDELPIRMGAARLIGEKYNQLILDYIALTDRFRELQHDINRFNKKGA